MQNGNFGIAAEQTYVGARRLGLRHDTGPVGGDRCASDRVVHDLGGSFGGDGGGVGAVRRTNVASLNWVAVAVEAKIHVARKDERRPSPPGVGLHRKRTSCKIRNASTCTPGYSSRPEYGLFASGPPGHGLPNCSASVPPGPSGLPASPRSVTTAGSGSGGPFSRGCRRLRRSPGRISSDRLKAVHTCILGRRVGN